MVIRFKSLLPCIMGVLSSVAFAGSTEANAIDSQRSLDLRVKSVRDALQSEHEFVPSDVNPEGRAFIERVAEWGNWSNWNNCANEGNCR